jgi:Coenzyme PQQ synthesis protein D (PqqD)
MRLRQDGVTWQVAGDDVVVLDLSGSMYFKVNGSGRVLWEALAEPRSPAELEGLLVDRYGIDEARARADVAQFVADLRDRGLVVDD